MEGVEIEVTGNEGERIDGRLIKNMNRPRQSDDDGVLTIYTYEQNFGGSEKRVFFLIPIREGEPPVLDVKFVLKGKEVYKTSYKALSEELIYQGTHDPGNVNRQLRKTIVINP